MSYVDNNLLVGEHVLYRAHMHWIIFATSVLWLVLALVFFSAGHFFVWVGYGMLVATAYDFLLSFIQHQTSEFALTNKRVLVKVGFIRRTVLEIFLQKIEGIQVNQTILGRILNYGTIMICGVGGSRDPFRRIAQPLEFRKRVQQQIEQVLAQQK